jgi:hypothetical protein
VLGDQERDVSILAPLPLLGDAADQ